MLNEENYYQDHSYFSYSGYKRFWSCEASALAEIRGETVQTVTEAMLIGSYVDAWIEGTLDKFILDHPEIISSKGATKGQLKSSFKSANRLIERFQRDKLFMKYLQGEKQTILTGTISDIPVKGKLDILHSDRIVDFKTTKDFNLVWKDGERLSFIEFWGYDIQGAIYQELVRQKTGKLLPFYIAVITKEPEPDIAVIHIPDDKLKTRLEEVKHFLPQFNAIVLGLAEPLRCEVCSYCKRTKVLTEAVEMDEALTMW